MSDLAGSPQQTSVLEFLTGPCQKKLFMFLRAACATAAALVLANAGQPRLVVGQFGWLDLAGPFCWPIIVVGQRCRPMLVLYVSNFVSFEKKTRLETGNVRRA